MDWERRRVGVLVVGGGIAGCLAALEAARAGALTAMVLKGGPGRGARGSSLVAGGGFAAALGHTDPADCPQAHFRDTVRGGEFLNDQRLVRVMVEEAPARVGYLEELGVQFERDARGYRQRRGPGHSHPRSVMVAGGRMAALGRVLAQRVKESGVEVHRLTLADVRVADGRAVGAVCLAEDDRWVNLTADAVVLATGGLGRLYPVTSNPIFMTGDGYACGYRAGARLRDMEFVQFTPAGLVHPEPLRGWSIDHGLLAQPRARMVNGRRELICVPGEAAAHDLVARVELIRLLHGEIQSGRTGPHGGVHLDLREVPAEEVDRLAPALREALVGIGIDPARELLEVAPEAHFFMGGLDVNVVGETSLPGLFAVGEAAGGCHGANRLTHNAFPEAIVFASRAGKVAGERSLHMTGRKSPEPSPLTECRWAAAPEIQRELQSLMLEAAGPSRSVQGLTTAVARLRALRAAAPETRTARPADLLAGLPTRNLLEVAELVLRSALRREESRGAHFREDYPARDDARWLVNLMLECGPDGPRIWEQPTDLPYLRPGVV